MSAASAAAASGVVTLVRGDLSFFFFAVFFFFLACTESFLVHQLNCTSVGARGLAAALFSRWPSSDAYARRAGPSVPGTIDVAIVPGGRLTIIGLYAQRAPGRPRAGGGDDSAAVRLDWFRSCLDATARISLRAGDSVAMPARIGCGLAGGDWQLYRAEIDAWAARARVRVTL